MASHFEGFGMVLAESANYAIPSIAFDINTGPSDIIDNEKSGFLIEDGNLQEFADKLKILMQDESLREKFGKNAKEKMQKDFSQEFVIQKWNETISYVSHTHLRAHETDKPLACRIRLETKKTKCK